VIVTLTWDEVRQAADMGVHQVIRALSAGMQHRGGGRSAAWQSQITGFLGEMAVSKAMGLPFAPDLTKFRRTPDVGMYEVRSTSHDPPQLLVKPGDLLTRRFLLVVVQVPVCDIAGWIRGTDAEDVGVWCPKLYGGAWTVDRSRLQPFTGRQRQLA
jgi:hypothetical protein